MDFLKITTAKLDPTTISELVVHESCGAVAMFAGTTRDNFDGKQVVSLEYEAYDEMAKKEMTSICDDIRLRWPDVKHIAIHHRLGFVPVKEASVVIAISSPHRNTSLEALPFALDELKKSVPIWKKEYYKESADTGSIKILDFDKCPIVDDLNIPEAMVQITADNDEIQRRIQAFIELKRAEINENNLKDFTEAGDSCARVSSNVNRVKDSKGHLSIRKVRNETGPVVESKENSQDTHFSGVNERLEGIENFLKASESTPKDVYERLKILEDQIAHLKSVSPEYSKFLGRKNCSMAKKIVYTVNDLDSIIASMESK